MNLILEKGKYTVTDRSGHLETLRYGEPWRDHLGDNLIFAMATRIEHLQKALGLCTATLAQLEPGDSRCVSDQFVAVAAVEAGCEDDRSLEVIEAEIARLKEAPAPASGACEVSVEPC